MHPVLFDFGPVQIRFYGLMYVVAIVVGSRLIRSEAARKGLGLADDDVMNFIMWTVLGGIVGARIYYVLFNWSYYGANPSEIPAIWHGGLAIHGGLLGGISAAWYYLRSRGVRFWAMADAAAPAIILGQAFGRFGNFMNGDAHGRPTDMPWGVVFPESSIAGRQFPGIPLHPTMLYEMVINLAVFCLLWFVLRKRDHRDGFVFASYVLLYSTGRFFVEHFRADSLMLGPLRAAQVVSIAAAAGAALIIARKRLWTRR
ncbi:MAG TPA: prolipoprotein diacylglyceryl transferase [Deltaproteobacteria bacterium]|nr:prolipoprotein diacylglyceryl transferase [Deltaproteobacteria bacterium]